tara:strand:+ start:721 stop:1062 length:342 start_codon:yes stop_codon:yes gene_type:complete
MAFKMKGSAFAQKKRIKYDEDKNMEYVKHRGERIYGSWNEFEPDRKNRVNIKGLSDHIVEGSDGDLYVDEANWDVMLHNQHADKTEGTIAKQERRQRRNLRRKKREIRREKDD